MVCIVCVCVQCMCLYVCSEESNWSSEEEEDCVYSVCVQCMCLYVRWREQLVGRGGGGRYV